MSVTTAVRALNLRRGYALNSTTFGLAALFALVVPAAIYGTGLLTAAGVESVASGESSVAQAGGGAAISIITVIEASLLLGVILLYNWFPGWFRPAVRRTARIAFWGLLAVAGGQLAGGAGFAVVVGCYFIIQVFDQLDVYWLVNDVLGIGLAVYGAVAVAALTSPIVLGVALVGLSVYDHFFANEQPWMARLAGGAIRWKFPAMVIVPNRIRFKWSMLADDDRENDFIHFGLGVGDLVIPAAFAATVFHTIGGVPAVGIAIGIAAACLRLGWAIEHTEEMAGLPSLTTGCLGGYALGYSAVVLAGWL